jgi:NAD(P)-dependent dehydrogenase (short-subunit alcohol dehydrogenase family)
LEERLNLNLTDRLALVTGGSKGIGLACARALLAEGAKVAIASRSRANLDAALATLPGARGFAADFIDAEAAARTIGEIEDQLGPIDILVNSAGAAKRVAVDELNPAAWRAALDAKFFSYVNAIDPLVKLMAARGRGVIVNVIGSGGKVASPTHLAGGAANAALMLATAGLGNAYAKQGVRVVGVNPTLTETERFLEGLVARARQEGISIEEARKRSVEAIPLGRLARPEEIADAVVFLASDRATYITAVTLGMDGAQYPTVL